MQTRRSAAWTFLVLTVVSPVLADPANWKVSSDFPGGSPRKFKIDVPAKTIRFQPISEAGPWATWWYFKVAGLTPGEEIHIASGRVFFTSANVKPVVSTDGRHWKFFDERNPRADGPEMFFAWYAPYVLADAQELVADCEKLGSHAAGFELCKSEAGDPVPALRIAGAEKPSKAVWIQARQHAWEVGGSWVADGLARWASSDDSLASEFRKKVELFVVPIMDVDNCQQGNGGKDQTPCDHNQDWNTGKTPVWNSVAAAKSRLKAIDDDRRLAIFIDLHDPNWEGSVIRWCWQAESAPGEGIPARNTEAFLAAMQGGFGGPLTFGGPQDLGANYEGNRMSHIWVRTHCAAETITGCLEVPVAGGLQDVPQQHLDVGRQLGIAIAKYLGLKL